MVLQKQIRTLLVALLRRQKNIDFNKGLVMIESVDKIDNSN